jgi:SsrA-binding protein
MILPMAKKAQENQSEKVKRTPRISNRRAFHDYHVLEKVEAGLELLGTEVKSLRAGNAGLENAYAAIRGGQVFLVDAEISIYPQAVGSLQHEPLRERRLLLHSSQIRQLQVHVDQKGHTLIPLALYFKGGWAKCEIAAAIGKKSYDKRETLQKRDQERDIAREIRRRRD